MSKVNIVRQIRNKSNVKSPIEDEFIKEKKWNSRFHLGKLPAYNAHNDANCKYFYK